MANEAKYNEIAGVNKKEQEKMERQQKREDFVENVQDNINDAAKSNQTHESKLTFEDSVIEKIAAIACHEVSGVLDMKGGFFSGISEQFGGYSLTKGISADVGEKEAAIDAAIILEYGHSAPKVFEELKRNIAQSVGQMTGLKVVEVNVRVDDVMTRKEFELKRRNERNENQNYEQGPSLR
ncbi:putative alkaline shock family protein YloU [Peptoniphilus olsenii]|uniref:Alkaline shock family protein YloU n=1 Tax=Peptoniphilus olsenii TaxID=411570 RepID=A0ABV2JBE8_9FIRM